MTFRMARDTHAKLAIIIPAFRIRHLAEALESLARQTDQNFKVYIGDDASAEPLEKLVNDFAGRLNVHYHRFADNLGGKDLVAQWHRCILLSGKEPWLWLFSDDDVLEPDCVAKFYSALQRRDRAPVDLYRFQMDLIDENSARFSRPVDHPDSETSGELFKAFLTDRYRAWRAQDHIFSRSIFEYSGGFVEFPKAIYADYATWLRFASRRGVRTIRGPRVLWRSHTSGTSSGMRETHRIQWQHATGLYLTWLRNFSREHGPETTHSFQSLGRDYYFRELTYFRPPLNMTERKHAASFARGLFGCTWVGAYIHLNFALFRYRIIRSRLAEVFLARRMNRRLCGSQVAADGIDDESL